MTAPAYRDIELNALDPKTRKRFIDAIDGIGSPLPLLSQQTSTGGAVVAWCAMALAGISIGFFLAILEFGEPYAFAQSWPYVAGYAICAVFIAWGVLGAVRSSALTRAVPFKRGRYVFPTDMVIATGTKLRILPMAGLRKLDGVHRFVNGAYTGTDMNFYFDGHGREVFLVHGKERAEYVLEDLRAAQRNIADAVAHQDLQVIEALDVFFEARVKDEWNDPIAAARTAASPVREAVQYKMSSEGAVPSATGIDTTAKPINGVVSRAGMFSLAAIVLAPPFWLARNFASDEAAFHKAQAMNATWAWTAYVAENGQHRQEVVDHHLPEAVFADAQREGTVTALREFVRAHPRSRRVAEARAAIHERFAEVRQDFTSQAATSDAAMPAFMGDLLAWLEAHDSPPVRVRFVAPSAEALSLIDQNLEILGEVEGVTGGIAPVAPHFTAERSESRETNITNVLSQAFAPVFPTDVMQLTHAGRIADTNEEITQPTFDVSYTIRPSGSVYTSETSARGFVGIFVEFHIQMHIPGSDRTWGFDTAVEPPETFYVPTGYGGVLAGNDGAYTDGLVYSVMADRAFDMLENRLALAFFREGTPAYEQALMAAEREQRGEERPNPYGLPSLPGLGSLPTY